MDDDAGGDTWSDDVGGRIMVNAWVLLVDTLPTPGLEQQPIPRYCPAPREKYRSAEYIKSNLSAGGDLFNSNINDRTLHSDTPHPSTTAPIHSSLFRRSLPSASHRPAKKDTDQEKNSFGRWGLRDSGGDSGTTKKKNRFGC